MKRNIVIMGMKHSGKSTIGKLTADYLGLRFYDSDDYILRIYRREYPQRGNVSVREIFRTHGKEEFTRLETAAIQEIAEQNISGVIALGGGTIENRDAIKVLKKNSVFVYLFEEKEILYPRIIKNGVPPFLDTADPEGSFHRLYVKRTELYRRQADFTVNCGGGTVTEVCRSVTEELKKRN